MFNASRQLRRVLLAIPLSYGAFWEYRVYADRQRIKTLRERFTGPTAFYGKRWGYTTDQMVEDSLRTGDIVYCSYATESLHIPVAFRLWVLHRFAKVQWDECYVVLELQRRKYLMRLGTLGNFELISYAEQLAEGMPRIVAVRRLQCENTTREGLQNTLVAIVERENADKPDGWNWRASGMSISDVLCYLERRSLGTAVEDQFNQCRSWLDVDRTYNILRVQSRRLESILTFLSQRLKLGTRGDIAAITNVQHRVQELHEAYKTSADQLQELLTSVAMKDQKRDAGQRELRLLFFEKFRVAELWVATWLKQLEKLYTKILARGEWKKALDILGYTEQDIQGLTDSFRRVGHKLKQKSDALVSLQLISTAGVAVGLYQRAGLLPSEPGPQLWTADDLFVVHELLNPYEPNSNRAGALAAGPLLSNPFYIRDEGAEIFAKRNAAFRRRMDFS